MGNLPEEFRLFYREKRGVYYLSNCKIEIYNVWKGLFAYQTHPAS